uniref:Ig-like domain-containing protein n=1 Tax=Denticeps clupeoides TaxID=299321 RepID=A0AAY4E9C0_9TELE
MKPSLTVLSIDVTLPPLRAVVELATGRPELLSGDSFQLTCHVPEEPSPFWSFQWFRNGRLVGNATSYEITKARVQHGGFYTCKGARETELNPQGVMHTLTSPPLKMHVDGGWVILQASTDPMIVQESLILMCRIRGNPIPSEVILYRDGTEILRHHHNILVIPNLTLDDQGMYWCRATWENKGLSQAAQSLAVKVNVLGKILCYIIITIVQYSHTIIINRCTLNYNSLTFNNDDKIMAPATSSSEFSLHNVAPGNAGLYRCKAGVKVSLSREGTQRICCHPHCWSRHHSNPSVSPPRPGPLVQVEAGPYWTPGQCPVHRACPGNVPCGLRLPPARLAGACCAL